MNKNYNLTWDLKRLGTKVILDRSFTSTYNTIDTTIATGAKLTDLDNVKIELEVTYNFYTKKPNNEYIYYYTYVPLKESSGGIGGNPGAYLTGVNGSCHELYSPRDIVIPSGANAGTYHYEIAMTGRPNTVYYKAGVNMPTVGKASREFTPTSDTTSFGTYINMYGQVQKTYHIDAYETTTEYVGYQGLGIQGTWASNGDINIKTYGTPSSYYDSLPRDSITWKVKITGHGKFDIA